ncbi:hypothetical protein [Agromyces subbeticus]|uniref:DUF7882 family protein n=1 Tax=Agromyces subbeticus TaxID=293890 RepID=UPI0003B5F5E2|nr:hypothetical protein [Agromyces subbeticus]
MGMFIYGHERHADFDDRVLAHLQMVMTNKLRRQESFSFSWQEERGWIAIWIHPSVSLQFIYTGNREPALNMRWLDLLAEAANSVAGLVPVPEPAGE